MVYRSVRAGVCSRKLVDRETSSFSSSSLQTKGEG